MRIVAASRIMDEADIAEAFIRHTAAFVDHHLLLDNRSRDGTRDILRALHEEGLPITVFDNPSVAFAETEANSFLFEEAARAQGAHWVVFLDTDEFIDERRLPGGFRPMLAHAAEHRPLVSQVKVALTEYVPIHTDDPGDPIVPTRVAWRAERSENFKAILHTRILDAGARVRAGGHGAHWPGTDNEVWPYVIDPVLTYAHYPERSAWQWIAKFVRGWTKVLAAGQAEVARGTSAHYRDAFEMLRDHPGRILDHPTLMGFKTDRPGLSHAPIDYRGGPLRHTPPGDDRLRAMSAIVRHLEDLSIRHGALLTHGTEARALARAWDTARGRLL